MIEIITGLNKKNKTKVRTLNEEFSKFDTKIDLKQGCVLWPLLFSIIIDDAIKKTKAKCTNMRIGNWKQLHRKNCKS